MTNEFDEWKGKKVFLATKIGRKYSGKILEVTEHFIFLLDKFANKVTISISEISSLEEDNQ